MLDQLRAALNMAQAIQADVDKIIAQPPDRQRPHKIYTFTGPTHGWRPELTIAVDFQHATADAITQASYNRFVALANSGNYHVEILDHDYGVAWQLRRKARA